MDLQKQNYSLISFIIKGVVILLSLLGFLGQYICFLLLHVCGNGTFPKPLSSKEERECLIKAKSGDIESRNKLVEHNLRLVAHIIKKYYSSRSDQDDLVSIGTIGLIKAINTFDINKNIKLSSYASRCIENEILMYFRNLKKTSQDISLNEAIDMDKDGNPLSLYDVLSTDDNILDNFNKKLNLKKIYEYIDSELDEREKQVITLRYGLNGKEPVTQREVADILGVSRSYISRIETKALKTLRRKYERSNNL